MIPPQLSFKMANKLSKSSSDYNHNDKYIDTIMRDIVNYAKYKWSQELI